MRIASRPITPDLPPYTIAEIGVNHDGSVERALALVRAADEAGADAVKLQLFKTDLLMSRAAKLAAYQQNAGETDPLAMLRRLELSIDQMAPVVELAHDLGLRAIVTVFSTELVSEAERLPWDAYKTASPDLIHKPLLDRLAATGKPLILSTGAASLDEVGRTLLWLAPAHERLALLQCVSAYPTPPESAALGGIRALRDLFPGPVGYSDHTTGIDAGWMAVACGATILEKHLTYDRAAAGPDHAASLDQIGFRDYAMRARLRHATPRGVGWHTPAGVSEPPAWAVTPISPPTEKRVLDIEADVRRVSRQSLTSTRPLPAGHALTPADLTVKRPGAGLEPFRLHEVLGRALARPVEADMPLMPEDLS